MHRTPPRPRRLFDLESTARRDRPPQPAQGAPASRSSTGRRGTPRERRTRVSLLDRSATLGLALLVDGSSTVGPGAAPAPVDYANMRRPAIHPRRPSNPEAIVSLPSLDVHSGSDGSPAAQAPPCRLMRPLLHVVSNRHRRGVGLDGAYSDVPCVRRVVTTAYVKQRTARHRSGGSECGSRARATETEPRGPRTGGAPAERRPEARDRQRPAARARVPARTGGRGVRRDAARRARGARPGARVA